MTKRRRLSFRLPLPLLAVAGILLPISRSDAPPQSAAEAAYQALPPRPAGDVDRGRAGVERTAIGVAAWLRAVPMQEGSADTCAPDQLRVSWDEPSAAAKVGNYVPPLGPAPDETTTAVNGIVVCATSDYAFMGFEARYVGGRWDVVNVPTAAPEEDEPTTPALPEKPSPSPVDVASFDGRIFGAAIEAPAAYEPQRTCDATPKIGAVALKNLLLKTYAGSRSLGIGTACNGSVSEHHEGRAFDWGVRATAPAEKAMAQSFIDKVLATDQYGHEFALARRMGVMYLIWNHQIWSAYRAREGWRPYSGASAHTDHIHISMSWAGGLGRTSFWSGNVAQVLAASPVSGGGSGAPVASARPRTTTTTGASRPRPTTIDTQLTADETRQRAERLARRQRTTTTLVAGTTTTSSTTSTTWRPRPPRSTTTTTMRPTTTTTVRPTTTTTVRRRRVAPPSSTTTVPPPTTTTAKPTTTSAPATTTTAPQ